MCVQIKNFCLLNKQNYKKSNRAECKKGFYLREGLKKKHYKLGFLAEVRGGRGQRGFQVPNLLMVII